MRTKTTGFQLRTLPNGDAEIDYVTDTTTWMAVVTLRASAFDAALGQKTETVPPKPRFAIARHAVAA